MHIHFICEGNTTRSRLAEAYLKSLQLEGVKVSSSGTRARNDRNGPVAPEVLEVAKDAGIASFFKMHWDQLNQDILDVSDIVICMNRRVYREAHQAYQLPLRTIIWDVDDVRIRDILLNGFIPTWLFNREKLIFGNIKRHALELVGLLKKAPPGDRIAVLNEQGQPTGDDATIAEIYNQGLWFMGAHIVLFNAEREVLLVRRSPEIVCSPGLWEVGVGGSSRKGESPEQCILREVFEELGISLDPGSLVMGGVMKYAHYLPHYGFHIRAHLHSFAAQIAADTKLKVQESEVAATLWLSIKEVKRAIRKGRGDFGELVHQKRYYQSLMRLVEKSISL